MSMKYNCQSDHRVMVLNPIFRSESMGSYHNEQNYTMMEKRQLFLRSYQFSREKSLTEKIKSSLVRVKRVFWFRLRSARKWRKFVLSRFKWAFYHRKRRFLSILNNSYYKTSSNSSSCFW